MNTHTDAELAAFFNKPILERVTIHEWPLSIVQRLTLADGTRLAYKSQLPPTVEPAFYARASALLLPRHRDLGTLGDCHIMTFEWLESQTPIAPRRVVDAIARLPQDLPVYTDIGTPDAWAATVSDTFDKLSRFLPRPIDELRRWAKTCSIAAGARVCHGDLKADQVFLTADGYRVIDWQRPVKGPAGLDLVSLLIDLGVDPAGHTDPATIQLHWFLRLRWAAIAQVDLFPGFTGDLFRRWAGQAIKKILS